MITHKDVAHFYDLLSQELRLSVEFSRSLAQQLISGESRIMEDLHSVSIESIQDTVALRDLPHYPLNFVGLPPKFLGVYVSSLLLLIEFWSSLSRFGFSSVERVAEVQQAQG